jgi:hypothetical protein
VLKPNFWAWENISSCMITIKHGDKGVHISSSREGLYIVGPIELVQAYL